MSDSNYMRHDAPRPAPRQSNPGEVLYRVRDANGHVHRCELRTDRCLYGRGDLQFFEDDEFLFSRMCSSDAAARTIAEMAKQDHLRTGFKEISE